MDFLASLIEELNNDTKAELSITDDDFDEDLLLIKVKAIVREVMELRGYTTETEDFILKDMQKMYSKIRGRIICSWNKVGAEGEDNHSEKNISRSYTSVDTLYPITKIARIAK